MYWLSHPVIHAYYQKAATNGRHANWVNLVGLEHISDGARVASLGCGVGDLERHLLSLRDGIFIEAVDLSKDRIAQARENAAQAGLGEERVRYAIDDFDTFLGSRTAAFDVIVFNMSLHHAVDPFTTLLACRSALRAGGKLVLNEYFGPARLQPAPKVVRVIDSILANAFEDANPSKPSYPDMLAVYEADASEAPNPTVILPAAATLFSPTYFAQIATGLMQHCCNFFESLTPDQARHLCALDALLLQEQVLECEFGLGIYTNTAG